jgi:hypothetical protein
MAFHMLQSAEMLPHSHLEPLACSSLSDLTCCTATLVPVPWNLVKSCLGVTALLFWTFLFAICIKNALALYFFLPVSLGVEESRFCRTMDDLL